MEVLEGQCLGSVKAVWSCVDGHRYIMDTQCATTANPEHKNSHLIAPAAASLGSGGRDGEMMSGEEETEGDKEDQLNKNERERLSIPTQNNPLEHAAQARSSDLAQWTCHSEGETGKSQTAAGLLHMVKYKFTISRFFFFIFHHFNFFKGWAEKNLNPQTENTLHKKYISACMLIIKFLQSI